MDLPTNLLIFFIPLFLITGQILSQSEPKPVLEYCVDDAGNYTAESTYKTNIDYLLSNLTSLASSSLFNDHSVGEGTADQTYGLYMCRGDFTSKECDTCIKAASTAIVEKCPVYKEAIMWYENCMIRYANRDIFSLEEIWPVAYQWSSNFNASDPSQFGQLLAETVNGLIPQGAYNSSNKGYAAGKIKMSLFEDLYVLIQCTPDILGEPCEKCLRVALRNVGTCCGTISLMMSMYLPSCWLHHSNTPLVRELDDTPSVSPASPVLPPAPAPPSPLSNETNSSNSIPPEGSSAATITEEKGIMFYITRVGAPVVGFVLLLLCIIAFSVYRRKKKQLIPITDIEVNNPVVGENISAEQSSNNTESLQYSLDTIKCATRNFAADNKLGQGGFGDVYKGKLPNGQEVAVKRLSEDSSQGLREFTNEVELVAKLQHRNLVKLLGYCLEGEEKLLVYEFVPNLSLDKFLFDANRRKYLDWETRFKIIVGIARGLLYLHVDSRYKIIHRDLKSSNILLDEDMNTKVADFGMARLMKMDHTQANTSKIFGTYGYMAPEYYMSGAFSIKSDVYSFGVMLLEIISGQSNSLFSQSPRQESLISYASRLWNTGRMMELVDPLLGNNFSTAEVLRCIQVGVFCVQEDPSSRPTMDSAFLMLHNNSSDMQNQPRLSAGSSGTSVRHEDYIAGRHDHQFDSKECDQPYNARTASRFTDLYPR